MSKETNHTSDLTLYVSSFLSQLPLPIPELLLGSWFGLEDTQHLLHNTRFNSSLNSKELSLSLSGFRRSTDHCCGSESLENGKKQIRFPKSGEAFRQETECRETLISHKKFCQNKQATENLKPHNPQSFLLLLLLFPLSIQNYFKTTPTDDRPAPSHKKTRVMESDVCANIMLHHTSNKDLN
jgi:hypothetical protein